MKSIYEVETMFYYPFGRRKELAIRRYAGRREEKGFEDSQSAGSDSGPCGGKAGGRAAALFRVGRQGGLVPVGNPLRRQRASGNTWRGADGGWSGGRPGACGFLYGEPEKSWPWKVPAGTAPSPCSPCFSEKSRFFKGKGYGEEAAAPCPDIPHCNAATGKRGCGAGGEGRA